MAEYTVDTLVHLYDSVNSQIAEAQSDLNDCMHIDFDPTTKNEAIDLIYKRKEKRLEKLYNLRDNVEEQLNKFFNDRG